MYVQQSGGNTVNGLNSSTNIILENNIMLKGMDIYNAAITNNILVDGGYNGSATNTVQYNICNGTQFPANGYNQQNVNMSTVFLGTGSTDGQWQLAPGSPAIGTGVGGTDIGMYGGVDPYVLSGIPAIPTIYQFFGSNAGSQSLPVELKIKARK
jgi:hypothetical protein